MSLEALARLRPIREGGTVTVGNASGINDGAAALLVASQQAVDRYGLAPLAWISVIATRGRRAPDHGHRPRPQPKSCSRARGSGCSDIDVIELNEAFAAQALAVLRRLGLPDDAEHVNPNGGAIALGHPIGMSGAAGSALTAAIERQHRQLSRGVVTMCIGVGQGISVLLEAV